MKAMAALETAKKFIEVQFPDCDAALLAGSVTRGEETATSDLDIIIFKGELSSAYRESLFFDEWPIEVFVHSFTSFQSFFKSDRERGRPSLQKMISEGIVLRDHEKLNSIKNEASKQLEAGPGKWDDKTIQLKRYFLSDVLEDFIGCQNRSEGIFIAGRLAELLHEFILRTHNQWTGESKWIYRALRNFDEELAGVFAKAFDDYYTLGNKSGVVKLTDKVLAPFGGRLFEGFSVGK
ncbi:nucleotidyltransferase domain-containing protein [Falsibacillus pallidus]|uniref:nucleotidyltransferase domain-containing protein n=1 Tax=Falsibacillus pallidus TaxID=493781 RepID=UPI003D95F63B